MREDPGSDDERTIVNNNLKQQDEQAIRLNGGISGDGEDADMQDADDDDDMDDDMMDKISSSPSIDDGRYSSLLQTPPWPKRRESLTPRSSPIPPAFHSSSPFTTTPLHFPISLEGPRRPCSVLAPHTEIDSPSPSPSSHIPFSYQFTCETESPSMEHHHGEYTWTRTTEASNIDENDTDDDSILDQQMSPTSRHMTVIERRLRILREDSQGSLMSDLDEELKADLLKPVCMPRRDSMDDPFVETNAKDPRKTNGTSPLIPHDPNEDGDTEDNDSWTTDSDADSWNADLDDDDDASNDVIFSDDPRFVDSGWGGECLRETEDIDFEFVYALHTFVATVEGQANATKGDTMVLLDDSNSYWWLVRVVKDSSIGKLYGVWMKHDI